MGSCAAGGTGLSYFMPTSSLVEFVVDGATDEWINVEKKISTDDEIKLLNK